MLKTILKAIMVVAIALLYGMMPALALDSENGAKIFQANCAGCHANGGNIIRRGKNLKLKALQRNKVDTLENEIDLITNGKNNMSAYKDRLSPQEIANVSAYVLEKAQNNWR